MKILCLSFRTPPQIRPQAILIGKMIPEWIRQGAEPIIITYDGGEWRPGALVYKIPTPKISPRFYQLPIIGSLLENLYYRKLFRLILGIIKKHSPSLIFSFSNPQASNLLGARLKKKTGLPFVSHFSDPWYLHPFLNFSPKKNRKIYSQEKFVIENSDRVVFVNDVLEEYTMKNHPSSWREKCRIVPHCFDKKDYPVKPEVKNKKFTFSHIGAFYPQRNPEIFLKAFSKIFARRPELKQKIKIELVGATNAYAGYDSKKLNGLLDGYNLNSVAEIIPQVSYLESLGRMTASNCLFVIDADIPGSMFLPSKAIDYAGSGTPIIGLTPKDSPTEKFLAGLGCPSFHYDQIEALEKTLEKIISGEMIIRINKDFISQFQVESTTEKLLYVFKEVLA
ncbi:MAG: glycosyltransferase [Patescibacteria group bacterium]|jgi:glycosyltransferase involved in cell wall biosynthesis